MERHGQITPAYRSDTIALDETDILSWLHFGDLHITTETAENYGDFLALIGDANRHLKGGIAFAVLPDNAENGTEEDLRDHALDGTNRGRSVWLLDRQPRRRGGDAVDTCSSERPSNAAGVTASDVSAAVAKSQ